MNCLKTKQLTNSLLIAGFAFLVTLSSSLGQCQESVSNKSVQNSAIRANFAGAFSPVTNRRLAPDQYGQTKATPLNSIAAIKLKIAGFGTTHYTGWKVQGCYIRFTGHNTHDLQATLEFKNLTRHIENGKLVIRDQLGINRTTEYSFSMGQSSDAKPYDLTSQSLEFIAQGEDKKVGDTDPNSQWAVAFIKGCSKDPNADFQKNFPDLKLAHPSKMWRLKRDNRAITCLGSSKDLDNKYVWKSLPGKIIEQIKDSYSWKTETPTAPGFSGGPCFEADENGEPVGDVIAQVIGGLPNGGTAVAQVAIPAIEKEIQTRIAAHSTSRIQVARYP